MDTSTIQDQAAVLARWRRLGYLFPFLKGIVYPLFKISLIALASELLREVLRISLDPEFFERIDDELYGTIRESSITSVYLMESLSFYQAFGVVCAYIVIISIVQPIHIGLNENFNCYMEVKRLQMILYDKFILEPNSVNEKEARELVYNGMNSIEKYWSTSKYCMIDDCTSAGWSLLLVFILAWDMGLIITGAVIIIMLGTKFTWNKLSTPWAEQREDKMSAASARLMDLVTCKEVVLSHTTELDERASLFRAVYSDKIDIQHLFWAKTASGFLRYLTFSFVMPVLFVYVYEVDLTMERVFQVLLLIVIQDEMVRAYLSYSDHGPVNEEYARVKKTFARVLEISEEELFPPDFAWVVSCAKTCSKMKGAETSTPSNETRPRQFDSRRRSTLTKRLTSLLQFDPERSSGSLQGPTIDYRKTFRQTGEYRKKLALDNVSLGYRRNDGSLHVVVEDMYLKLDIGEHYALMGETGAEHIVQGTSSGGHYICCRE